MKIKKNNRGAALVEFALVALLLITLVFGVIEFSLMMKDFLTLNEAAVVGVRSASIGSPTSTIVSYVQGAATTLTASQITITLQTRSSPTGTWTTLGNATGGLSNAAQSGDQVRVTLSYPHQLVTGTLFSWISGGSTVTVYSDMVMQRE
jgi:Flp pilus assembly protein TadG